MGESRRSAVRTLRLVTHLRCSPPIKNYMGQGMAIDTLRRAELVGGVSWRSVPDREFQIRGRASIPAARSVFSVLLRADRARDISLSEELYAAL
jgi:hypothetical protein